jgi:hypothetical protein
MLEGPVVLVFEGYFGENGKRKGERSEGQERRGEEKGKRRATIHLIATTKQGVSRLSNVVPSKKSSPQF